MDALVCLNSRRSIRSFKSDPIEFEKIISIIDAAIAAPSAGNLQDCRFILVVDKEKRELIAEKCSSQLWLSEAPVHIVICTQPSKEERAYGDRGKNIYSVQNSAAAAENILLAAHAQGIGACWVGAFLENDIRKILSVPSTVVPLAIIALGYSKGKLESRPKLTLQDVLFFEKWGNRSKKSTLKSEYEKITSGLKEKAKKLLKYIKKKS